MSLASIRNNVVKTHNRKLYISKSSTGDFNLFGFMGAALTLDTGVDVATNKGVCSVNTTSYVTGYSKSISFSQAYIQGSTVCDILLGLVDNMSTYSDCVFYMLEYRNWIEHTDKQYRYKVSISVESIEAEAQGILRISGKLSYIKDTRDSVTVKATDEQLANGVKTVS